jgi:hypothetical protein
MKKAFITSFLLLTFLVTPGLSFAENTAKQLTSADFTVCANPQGTLRAEYASGTHGIPGSAATYTGSDKVFQLQSPNQLTQCFCSEDGFGIQTNWLKIKDMSKNEIESYKKSGWIYIPNGSNWGLEEGPYLAFNIEYSCKSNSGSGGGPGTSTGGGNSGGSTTSTSTSTTTSNPSVIGLATTGNTKVLALITALGAMLVVTGLTLRRTA